MATLAVSSSSMHWLCAFVVDPCEQRP